MQIRNCDTAEYFRLVEDGRLSADDHVELLEGLIVSMAPQHPAHAATVWWICARLGEQIGERFIIRSQLPFLAGRDSAPEPDIAVVPWRADGWKREHPSEALLVIEVADSSIGQDRLTKSRIYAAAGVPDYWLVNLRESCIEWFASPDPAASVYRESGRSSGGEVLPRSAVGLELSAERMFPPDES